MRLFLAALTVIAGTMPAAAQWVDRPWPGIPRAADGKPNLSAPAPSGPDGKPDLTGVWSGEDPAPRPDPWSSRPDASAAVQVSQEMLARYVGVYKGIYQGNPRTVQISLSDGRLWATVGRDTQPLAARSETLFESGLGYQFVVDATGPATHVIEIHVSGNYRYARQP